MPFIPKQKTLRWTHHARAKMAFYKLSEQRVRRVINTPKRTEEGIAPKTIAVMQPVSVTYRHVTETVPSGAQRSRGTPLSSGKFSKKREETWNQEIWVMFQDKNSQRKIISAWRYPGRTKPKSEAVIDGIRAAYNEYMNIK